MNLIPVLTRQLVNLIPSNTILEEARRIGARELNRSDKVIGSKDAALKLQVLYGSLNREVFAVTYLDTHHQVIKHAVEFTGTINAASVYPREVVKSALEVGAAAVICSHNHPSGVCSPSDSDVRITRSLEECCKLFGIRVLDHIIVSALDWYSFADAGRI